MNRSDLDKIYLKIRNEKRISPLEALELLRHAPWLELAQLAWERRVKVIDDQTASYTLFGIINYTNVCKIGCSFCSFKREVSENRAYVLSQEEIFSKIDNAAVQGVDQVFFQGGVHPDLKLEYYTGILEAVKEKYGYHVRGFSPVELKHLADQNKMPVKELISILKQAGLGSVPGAGAEILTERVRKILSPEKCTVKQWADIMMECHKQGLMGSANIVFGSVETDSEIIEHLDLVRTIQDQTKGFNSFIPWTFQQQTNEFQVKDIPHHIYLKMVSLCRIFLDNITNLEVSVLVLGSDIGKLALRMGANDISSPVIEENVLRSHGVKSEKESGRLIEGAGFRPLRRDFNYTWFKESGQI